MRRLVRVAYLTSCVGCTILLGVWHSTAQDRSNPVQKPPRNAQLEQRLAELPIVEFNEADSAECDPERASKNRRHNSPVSQEGVRRPRLNENMDSVVLDLPITHQRAEPAFPVACDVILIGTIAEAKAYLSSDRTGIYSEVTVSIEDILKGDAIDGLKIGSTLNAERTGGAARFPSGKILWRGPLGKNLPSKGNRYLLFLNKIAEGGFSIATGYELTANGVVPLDGVPGGTYSQFENYESFRNASEASLLEAVRKALSHNRAGPGGL